MERVCSGFSLPFPAFPWVNFICFAMKFRYSLAESTWEPEESMFDAPFMIEKFRADALQEGIDIEIDKDGLILLQVAKDPCIPNP